MLCHSNDREVIRLLYSQRIPARRLEEGILPLPPIHANPTCGIHTVGASLLRYFTLV